MLDRKLLFSRVMVSSWFANAMMMMGFVVIMPFIPLYVQELGVSEPAAVVFWSGAIFSAFALAAFFTSPLMGNLADRIGPRPVIAWGFVVAAVTFLLMGMTTNLYVLVFLRFLQGLFGAGGPSATSALVANSVPREKMGQAFGFFQTSMTVSMGAGPLVGGLVADAFGLREAFHVSAGLMVVGLLVTLAFIPRVRLPSLGARPGPIQELRQIATTPGLSTVWVAMVMLQVSMAFVIPIFPLFLQEMGVVQVASTMGVLMVINAVASTLATPATGVLADRTGHRRVLIVSLWASGLAAAATVWVFNVVQLALLRVVAGIVGAGIGPTTSSLVAEASGQHQRGGAFGVLSTARTMGMLIGPALGGFIVQFAGLRGAFVATGLIMMAVGVWVAVTMKATREPEAARGNPMEPGGPVGSQGDREKTRGKGGDAPAGPMGPASFPRVPPRSH